MLAGAVAGIVAAIVLMRLLAGSGSGQPAPRNSSQGMPSATNGLQSEASVELAPDQLNSIKIAPVETSRFPLEIEAVGTINKISTALGSW